MPTWKACHHTTSRLFDWIDPDETDFAEEENNYPLYKANVDMVQIHPYLPYLPVNDVAATVFRTPYLPEDSIAEFEDKDWPTKRHPQKGARVLEKFIGVPHKHYVRSWHNLYSLRRFITAIARAVNGHVPQAFLVLDSINNSMNERDPTVFAYDLASGAGIRPAGLRLIVDEINELGRNTIISYDDGLLWAWMYDCYQELDHRNDDPPKRIIMHYDEVNEFLIEWRGWQCSIKAGAPPQSTLQYELWC